MSAQERVDALDPYEFDVCADGCVATLRLFGQGFAQLSPGDATMYRISIVQPLTADEFRRFRWEVVANKGEPTPYPTGNPYYVASSFGPMYPWNGQEVDTSYVLAKWTHGGRVGTTDEWTAAVIARFLNTLARKLREA